MKFHTGKRPFRTESPMLYSSVNESAELQQFVCNDNEASVGKGLKYLRSFLSNVVAYPEFAAVKPVLTALNSREPASSVAIARGLLTQTYESAEQHFAHVQVAAFVKKYPFEGSETVRRENALRKFLRGERRNRHMNALLRRRRQGTTGDKIRRGTLVTQVPGFDPNPLVRPMRDYIRRVIGDKPDFKSIFKDCRWGPGAVVGVNGQFTNFARKLLSERWTVTPAAIPYVLTAAKRYPMFWELLGLTKNRETEDACYTPIICVDPDEFESRFRARLVVVQHNKIAFASKDSDCDRTIASEPLLDQWLQLATDDFMKLRLKRVGMNLSDQRPNQLKAREGSIGGYNPYCTADLKNASGSVFTELVRELFPSAWFIYLNSIRSPSWMVDNEKPVKYHGFVSMGNGYCFPLETLIFASICYAAHVYTGTDPDFRVYGDDIIVRQNESGILQEYLRYFGFELNPEKSFFFGPFRESCGADWLDGKPVRPVYVDDPLDSIEQRIRAHNAFARLPNEWAGPLAHCCRNWFPKWISKLCRPFAGETDEAIDNRHWTIDQPWHLRNKTLQCPAWYGLSFRSVKDSEIERHANFSVAYTYGALLGSDPLRPFAARRETQMSVKRFYHGGGWSQSLPFEDNRRETAWRPGNPGDNDEHARLFRHLRLTSNLPNHLRARAPSD